MDTAFGVHHSKADAVRRQRLAAEHRKPQLKITVLSDGSLQGFDQRAGGERLERLFHRAGSLARTRVSPSQLRWIALAWAGLNPSEEREGPEEGSQEEHGHIGHCESKRMEGLGLVDVGVMHGVSFRRGGLQPSC